MAVRKGRWVTDNGNKDEYLRRVMNNLYKYAKKKGLTYVTATIIIDEESDYVSIRTKNGAIAVSDEHCFKEMKDGNSNNS